MSARQKKFTQRNVYYLRASPYVVLQTILYLDHRHVEWMNQNPSILTQTLSILRTRIMPKLRNEADSSGKLSAMSKKERVDVYTHRDFQLAFFFRRMDNRHSVLLKEKSLIFPHDATLAEVKVEDEDGQLHAPIPRRMPAASASVTSTADSSANSQTGTLKQSPEPPMISQDIQAEPPLSLSASNAEDPHDGMPPPPLPSSSSRPRPSSRRSTINMDDDGGETNGITDARLSKRARLEAQVKLEEQPNQQQDIPPLQNQVHEPTTSTTMATSNGEDEDSPIIITEEDEEKMKPKLHVKYAGFRM
jgi:hypothetical protein